MNTPTDRRAAERQHEAELAEAILGYLEEHPQATDTLEGIAEWWILRHQARVVAARVARVLARLTTRGILEQIGTGEGSRYRLRQHSTARDALHSAAHPEPPR